MTIRPIHKFIRQLGFNIVKYSSNNRPTNYPPDFEKRDIEIVKYVRPFTYTSPERIYAVCQAVKYVISNQIPGDIVECGVWKGGSMMAAMQTLLDLGDTSRHFYLFDTFEGMTEPSENDISIGNRVALDIFSQKRESGETWSYSSLEEVSNNLSTIKYDKQKIHLIKGKVEDTLPCEALNQISILRLDTDWYESTKHELIHLFPRLSKGGVLIIDDYGEWKGARKATDDYIKENNIQIFLSRIDYTGRIGIK